MKEKGWKTVAGWGMTGTRNGLSTAWELGRVMTPIYLAVTFLKHTPAIQWLSESLSPAMKWFGLPGQAAIVLVLGNVINLYAGIGAMVPLQLNSHEVTVLGLMLGISHSLPIETAVLRKMDVPVWIGAGLRLGVGIMAGLLAHRFGS